MVNPWAIGAGVAALVAVAGRRRRGASPTTPERPTVAMVPTSATSIAGWPGYYLIGPGMVITPSGCVQVQLTADVAAQRGLAPVYPGGFMAGAHPGPMPPKGLAYYAPTTPACFVAGAGLKVGAAHMAGQLYGAVGAVAAATGKLRSEIASMVGAQAPALAPLLALADKALDQTPIGSVAGYIDALQVAADKAGIPTATVAEWMADPERAIKAAAAMAAAKAGI